MIELAKVSTAVAAPVDSVFNYVSNMENYGKWFPGVVAIRSKNNLAHTMVGKTYVETLSLPSGDFDLTIEVAQCIDNKIFLTKGDLIDVLPQMTVTFDTDERDSCKITLEYHSRSQSLTDKSDIIIALREDLGSRAKTGLSRLKDILES